MGSVDVCAAFLPQSLFKVFYVLVSWVRLVCSLLCARSVFLCRRDTCHDDLLLWKCRSCAGRRRVGMDVRLSTPVSVDKKKRDDVKPVCAFYPLFSRAFVCSVCFHVYLFSFFVCFFVAEAADDVAVLSLRYTAAKRFGVLEAAEVVCILRKCVCFDRCVYVTATTTCICSCERINRVFRTCVRAHRVVAPRVRRPERLAQTSRVTKQPARPAARDRCVQYVLLL